MIASLKILLRGLIDYAGLFPPATLPMDEAFRSFAAYRLGEHAWILSRFICPAARLEQVDEYASLIFGEGQAAWRLVVTWPGGTEMEAYLKELQKTLDQVADFEDKYAPAVRVEYLESKLPAAVLAQGEEAVGELVERAAEIMATFGVSEMKPFYEVDFKSGGPEKLAEAISALKSFNDDWAGETRYQTVGAKFRSGGTRAADFPSSKELAFFLAGCSRTAVPFKATAGLHHPLRRFDKSLGTPMHGFLNLYVALALASAGNPDLSLLVQVLESEDGADFHWEVNGLRWRDEFVSMEHLTTARELGVSFGSCSFEEPLQGLRALGLL